MYDITYWLRHFANAPNDPVLVSGDLLIEAAEEIERLRSLVSAQEVAGSINGSVTQLVE